MKKIFSGLFFLFFVVVHAQDSLYIQSKLHHYYYQNIINVFYQEPMLFDLMSMHNFTKTTLSYDNQYNHLNKKQQAKQVSNFLAEVQGVFLHKDIWFSGKMNYTRNFLSNHGWNTSNLNPYKNDVERSPIYKLSYQDANWDNQLYTLTGNMLLPIIKNKVLVNFLLDYKTSQFYRKDKNPLSKLNCLDFKGKATIYVKLNHNNYIGYSVGAGYLDNISWIKYLGGAFNENLPVYTEIYDRISYGYGTVEAGLSLKNTEYDTQYTTGFKYINKTKKNFMNSSIDYTHTLTKFNNEITSKDILLAKYIVDKFSAKFHWFDLRKGYNVSFKGDYTSGRNFRIIANGKNYDANSINTSLTIQKIKEDISSVKNNLGVKIQLHHLKKIDYQAVNRFNYTNTNIETFYGTDFYVHNKSKWYHKTMLGGRINIREKSQFLKKNRFTSEVAIPNFAIDKSNKIYTKLQLGYQQELKPKTFIHVGIRFNYDYFMDIPSKVSKNTSNLGGNLYFNIIY